MYRTATKLHELSNTSYSGTIRLCVSGSDGPSKCSHQQMFFSRTLRSSALCRLRPCQREKIKADERPAKGPAGCTGVISYSAGRIVTPDGVTQRQVVNTDSNCFERDRTRETWRLRKRRWAELGQISFSPIAPDKWIWDFQSCKRWVQWGQSGLICGHAVRSGLHLSQNCTLSISSGVFHDESVHRGGRTHPKYSAWSFITQSTKQLNRLQLWKYNHCSI